VLVQTIDVGEPIAITTKWWDDAGAPLNPATLNLTIFRPDGTSLVVAKGAMTQGATTDVWNYRTTATQRGLWRVHAEATDGSGAVLTPQDFAVLVDPDEATGWCGQWATWSDVAACGTPPSADEAQKDVWLDQATELLYLLTDRSYPGICTVTRSLCYACRTCAPDICSCDPYPSVDLGGRYPVWGAWDVTERGVVLDPTAYTVRGRRWLLRTDGQPWNAGVAWRASDPDWLRVTWAYGRQPPTSGRLAAARFALEIARRCKGLDCGLPQRITNVNREGLTYTVLDTMSILAEGRTGLDLVDTWIIAERRARKAPPHGYWPGLTPSRRIV
jgi:hypothetical protein